ncbi:OLC1v1011833C1 [Oldenlandia corymbosa var. corymbosa]|uniref:OLC1v1011833C1 n=1 Tax=Oldenlandia corymbosa var. corymbosa TaxID=529605 RepID=A0AAV1DUK5_OLDCO|nr:OLC1v1011833C1 [Oldenlandia corymbosa var. corymbosa]
MAASYSESSISEMKKEEKMGKELESEMCWRKEVDVNLKRLHSLLFGADVALENRDFNWAQALALGLVGFLDSRSISDADEAFIRPIRREALSKLESARSSLIPLSDRRAFELAGKEHSCVFSQVGDVDIAKLKESKYFQAILPLPQSKGRPAERMRDRVEQQEKSSNRASKNLLQTKLTYLYGNPSKPKSCSGSAPHNSSDNDCILVEMGDSTPNFAKNLNSTGPNKAEVDERGAVNYFGAKRLHTETTSPRIDGLKAPSSSEDTENDASGNGFVTARMKLEMETRQRRGLAGSPNASCSSDSFSRGYGGRSYGVSRRGIRGNFVPPIKSSGNGGGNVTSRTAGKGEDALDDSTKRCMELLCGPDGELPEKLRNLEPRLIEHVSNEIMDRDPNVRWDDIAGLEHAKKCVTEMVIWPLLRPDIFKGCRSPGRGLLLFGPPGTGKTMIGKAIAGEAKATFFYISASSLTSKWVCLFFY